MYPNTANKAIKAVEHARTKHPDFAENLYHAVSIAGEEFGELSKAINDGRTWEEIEAEAFDLIAVLVRIIEKDHLRGKNPLLSDAKEFMARLQHLQDIALATHIMAICEQEHVKPTDLCLKCSFNTAADGMKMWFEKREEVK